jgi:hypothetical protein
MISASRRPLASRIRKVCQPPDKSTAPQKRQGDDIDGPSRKHPKNSEVEPVGSIDEMNKTISASRRPSESRICKVCQPPAKSTAPQKCQGDDLDGPSRKRPKNSEVELVGSHRKVVIVRLYKDRLDWDHICKA